jgi:hypothetical protein
MGIVLAAVVVAAIAVRLPLAFHSFRSTANAEKGRNELVGALAVADSVQINDNWVRATFYIVPRHATFVVALPSNQAAVEQKDSVASITFAALPVMLEDFLLPRREVATATRGTFVLCYYCGAVWSATTRWLYNDHAGGLVGRVVR